MEITVNDKKFKLYNQGGKGYFINIVNMPIVECENTVAVLYTLYNHVTPKLQVNFSNRVNGTIQLK